MPCCLKHKHFHAILKLHASTSQIFFGLRYLSVSIIFSRWDLPATPAVSVNVRSLRQGRLSLAADFPLVAPERMSRKQPAVRLTQPPFKW